VIDALKALLKQPYWVIALILGVLLVSLPCVAIDKDNHWATHPPNVPLLAAVGIGLLVLSAAAFVFTFLMNQRSDAKSVADPTPSQVKESNGNLSARVAGCEVRVVEGRLEDYAGVGGTVVVLPCNEYFDDRCAGDPRSALGAYVERAFDGQVDGFISLMKDECKKKLGPGRMQQKTREESAESFGAGRCVLLLRPLGRSSPVALLSTTTQSAGEGLAARISYLFDGMRELVACLADERLNEVALPVLAAGHGGIDAQLAFVGTLLAVAEAARFGKGGQPLKVATIVIFRKDANSTPEVDRAVVRRALALVSTAV